MKEIGKGQTLSAAALAAGRATLMTKKGCLMQAFRGPKQIKLGSLHQTSSICLFFQSILRLHSLFSFKVVDGLCDPRDLEAHKVLIIS